MLIRWLHYRQLHDALASLQASVSNLHRRIDPIMPAIDDLQVSLTKITDAVNGAVTDIQNLSQQISQGNANNDSAAVEDAAQKLSALADNLNAAVNTPAPTT